jgi:hypothetical protein
MPIEVDVQQPRWRAVAALSLYCASRTTTNPPGKIQRASDHAATGCNVLDCFNTPRWARLAGHPRLAIAVLRGEHQPMLQTRRSRCCKPGVPVHAFMPSQPFTRLNRPTVENLPSRSFLSLFLPFVSSFWWEVAPWQW